MLAHLLQGKQIKNKNTGIDLLLNYHYIARALLYRDTFLIKLFYYAICTDHLHIKGEFIIT